MLSKEIFFSKSDSIITALYFSFIKFSELFSTGTILNEKNDFTSSKDLVKFLLQKQAILTL